MVSKLVKVCGAVKVVEEISELVDDDNDSDFNELMAKEPEDVEAFVLELALVK